MQQTKSVFYIIVYLLLFCSIGAPVNGQSQGAEEQNYAQMPEDKDLVYGKFLLKRNDIIQADKVFRTFIERQQTVAAAREAIYHVSKFYSEHLFFDFSIDYCWEGIKMDDVGLISNRMFYQGLIANYAFLEQYDLAKEFYHQSLKFDSDDLSLIANGENSCGEIYRLQGDGKNAISHFKKAIKINKSLSNQKNLLINYNNIGLAYLILDDFDKAQSYLFKSLNLIDSLDIIHYKQSIGISFGQYHLKKKDYKRALHHFTQTLTYDLNNHYDKVQLKRDAYQGLSDCHTALGNYKHAFDAYKKYQEYLVQIIDNKNQVNLYQNQLRSERDNHQEEVGLLNNQLAKKQRKNIFLSVIFGILLLMVSLIIYLLALKNKSANQKIELAINKNKIQQLELENANSIRYQLELNLKAKTQEATIKELEEKMLLDKIDSANRELTAIAIHLSNKNEALFSISSQIDELKRRSSIATNKSLDQISSVIATNLRFDDDWLVFKKHFTEVHPGFFKNLMEKLPALTIDEIKLCAYIRIQLSSKEIARLLNVTVGAINKRRNRLRKKLPISPNTDLNEYLMKLEKLDEAT